MARVIQRIITQFVKKYPCCCGYFWSV